MDPYDIIQENKKFLKIVQMYQTETTVTQELCASFNE